MPTQQNLPKWWQVYSNDEEKRLFVGKDGSTGLVRSPDYEWRSTDALAKESGLSKRRTEEILDKFHKRGVVLQHSKDPEKWGYWERVKPNANDPKPTVAEEDQKKRVDKVDPKKPKTPSTGTSPGTTPSPAPATPAPAKPGPIKSPSRPSSPSPKPKAPVTTPAKKRPVAKP